MWFGDGPVGTLAMEQVGPCRVAYCLLQLRELTSERNHLCSPVHRKPGWLASIVWHQSHVPDGRIRIDNRVQSV